MSANDAAQNMDRGFNDADLADIMSEIENLESQFVAKVADKSEEDEILNGLFEEKIEEHAEEKIDNQIVEAKTEQPVPTQKPVLVKVETPIVETKQEHKDPLDDVVDLTHEKLNIEADINEVVSALEVHHDSHHEEVEEVVAPKKLSSVPKSSLNISGVNEAKPRNIKHPTHPKKNVDHFTQLNFKIKHDTKMQLNFSIEDTTFSIFIDAENSMTMELADGIEFSFPFDFKKAS